MDKISAYSGKQRKNSEGECDEHVHVFHLSMCDNVLYDLRRYS